MSRLQRIIFISLLVAQGVVIGLVENMIPYPFAFAPGAKLGLANLITIIALFTMPKKDSFLLIWLRLILTTLLGGTVSTFLYSMSGSLLSYFGMSLVKQLGPKRVSIIGISAAGGFLHNVGQLITASWIAQSWSVMLCRSCLSLGSCPGSLSGSPPTTCCAVSKHCAVFKLIMNARPKSNGARIQNKGVNYETSFHVARVSSTAS